MSDSEPTESEFDRVRERATAALAEEGLQSIYVGLIDESGENEFYFANADEENLQQLAVTQLAMITRVIADQSDLNAESVAQLAGERARELDLRR